MADDSQELKLILSEMSEKIDSLRTEMREGFESVDLRFDETNGRIDKTNGRLVELNVKLKKTNDAFEQLRAEVGSGFAHFDRILAQHSEELTGIHHWLEALDGRVVSLETRVDVIEKRDDEDRNGDES